METKGEKDSRVITDCAVSQSEVVQQRLGGINEGL